MVSFDGGHKEFQTSEEGKIDLSGVSLTKGLKENIQLIKKIFADDDTLVIREFTCLNPVKVDCCIFFINGMINNEIINDNIMKPIMTNDKGEVDGELIDIINEQVMFSNEVKKSTDVNEMVEGVAYGDTLLIVDGCISALIINSKGWQVRSITEPDAEKVLRGPREGFTESILTNLSLIRKRLNTTDLKMKFRHFGTRSNTKACICYLDSLVDKKVLKELNKRLDSINIDAVLDSNYILECIKDSKYSPFKTIGTTERPDTLCAKMLEGRIGLVLDGTPVALTLPYIFVENFQSSDDYYLNFYFSSFGRMLRIGGFLLSTSVPALYIALTTYHREMLPTRLALSIAAARQNVPLPTVVECILILLIFEIIRETGIRMPSNIGQALSVVGALVIGQAAVEAKFISAPMVIIVAVTAITGLINTKMKGATVMLSFLFLLASTFLGLYGYFFACVALLIHLFSMESFGIEYTLQVTSFSAQESKDVAYRAPWWNMKTRPNHMSKNKTRSS